MYTDTTMCLRETDVDWNITWPTTESGQMVRQKCPGGAESIGMYSNKSFIIFLLAYANLEMKTYNACLNDVFINSMIN